MGCFTCRACRHRIVMPAFSEGVCAICGTHILSANTPVDAICAECANREHRCAHCGRPLKGVLIAIEGTDGSGKATQTKMLAERLRKAGEPVRQLSFPRYDSDSSALVRMYLSGAFGDKPEDVNAYAASTFYAVDRYASFKDDWHRDYERGAIIVTDRYTISNAIHQGAKLPEDERGAYLDWLYDLEFSRMGIPKPDIVFYLDVPGEVAAKLREGRPLKNHEARDIHEADTAYLDACRRSALSIAEASGWEVIACTEDGVMRTPEDISEELYHKTRECLKNLNT